MKINRRLLALVLVAVVALGIFPVLPSSVSATPEGWEIAQSFDTSTIPIPAEVLATGELGAGYSFDDPKPESLEPGQVWVGKKVEDLGKGIFKITLSAWGATFETGADGTTYTPPKEPMNGNLTVTDIVGEGFVVRGTLSSGFSQKDATITWTVDNSEITGLVPATIAFEVEAADDIAVAKWYYTNKDGAKATFKSHDNNPYYWTWEEKEQIEEYKADINWNNSDDTNAVVEFTLKTMDGQTVLTVRHNLNQYRSKQDYDYLILNPDPSVPLMYHDISAKGSGQDKEYQIFVAQYNQEKGCYDEYMNFIAVANNGGNITNVSGWTKTTKYIEITEKNGNDGGGNVTLLMNNTGGVKYKYGSFGYRVEYHYDDLTGTPFHTANDSGTLGEDIPYTLEGNGFATFAPGYNPIGTKHSGPIGNKITANEADNVVKVVFEKRTDLKYTVEYYKDSIDTNNLIDTENGQDKTYLTSLAFDMIARDLGAGWVNLHKPNGYKDGSVATVLPMTIQVNGNIVQVLYLPRDDLSYEVQYLEKDTEIALADKKVVFNQKYNDIVTENAITISGYFAATPTQLSITVSDTIADNLMKFYYFKNGTQTKDLSYAVEYYRDNVLVDGDTLAFTEAVWINAPDTLAVQAVNTSNNKYLGYRFEKTDPATIPGAIADGGVIKVYYVRDDSQTRNVMYTVKYTINGMEVPTDTYTVTKQVWINAPADVTVPVDPISAANDRYSGYRLQTNPFAAPATAQNGQIITVPYVTDDSQTKTPSSEVEYSPSTPPIIPETKNYTVKVNYINTETGTSMGISYNEITGIPEGSGWNASILASMQFDGYTIVRISGDPVVGSDIQRDQFINVYYAPVTVPTEKPKPTTQPGTSRGTTERATESIIEEVTAGEEITPTEPAIEEEPTEEELEEIIEEILEEEIIEAPVPLARVEIADEPPVPMSARAMLQRIAPTEKPIELIIEIEEIEIIEEPVPLGDFPAEEKKENPQTGDALAILMTTIMTLAGVGAAIFAKKRT